MVGSDGSGRRRLGDGYAACWSPDGRQILFTIGFKSSLWVMDADGSHERELVDVPAAEPDWR